MRPWVRPSGQRDLSARGRRRCAFNFKLRSRNKRRDVPMDTACWPEWQLALAYVTSVGSSAHRAQFVLRSLRMSSGHVGSARAERWNVVRARIPQAACLGSPAGCSRKLGVNSFLLWFLRLSECLRHYMGNPHVQHGEWDAKHGEKPRPHGKVS